MAVRYGYDNTGALATVTKDGVTWTNTYDSDGMRTKRTNGTTTYQYFYSGSRLSQMKIGSTVLNFAYDASGTPMAVTYGGATYYYATNIQGDVTAILNSSGVAVVEYTYNAWGKILSTSGTMASTLGAHNPLRYRGYVYDQESCLYYLQSRYYNPQMGRFICADSLVSTGQGILGNNMFAYCLNNPVNLEDATGSAARACFDDNDRLKENPWKDPISGGGAQYGTPRIQKSRKNLEYIEEYLALNTLKKQSYAFYNGVLYLKVDISKTGGAFSCIIVFIDDSYATNAKGANVVQHEYGHIVHLSKIGLRKYISKVAIPSMLYAGLTNLGIFDHKYYRHFPTEYIADHLGNASHTNISTWEDIFGVVYWFWTFV